MRFCYQKLGQGVLGFGAFFFFFKGNICFHYNWIVNKVY